MTNIINRNMGSALARLARQYPVVTVTGPRQSGKTTLVRTIFPTYQYINLENKDLRSLAVQDPREFLKRFNKNVIIDEIQRAPDLPSYIQQIVDEGDVPGRFIFTGSQQFEVIDSVNQSLAGRNALLRLLPFSLKEIAEHFDTSDIDRLLYQGFYPRIYDKSLNPTEAYSFYVSNYLERDIRQLIHIKDLNLFERFIELCAANIGSLINLSRIGNDVGVNQKTIKSWLSVLEASYIIFRLEPHHNNFRKRLVKASKLYFYDVGLASYLLRISNQQQVMTHPMRGSLFENLVVSEMLKNRFNAVKQNNLYFFRDNVGNEVDVIVDNGEQVDAVEIKSSRTFNEDLVKGLLYYQSLTKSANSTLVYTGEDFGKFKGIDILNYRSVENI